MLRMPVATLRVWERRYGVSQPALSPSGQRLYSADDVRRLALLKQLTDLGHAIGSLARLGLAELQQVAATHASVLAAQSGGRAGLGAARAGAPEAADRRVSVALIGRALGRRLMPAALWRLDPRPPRWLGPYDDVVQAQLALQGHPPGLVVLHQPRLHEGWLDELRSRAPALAARPLAVLYRYAAESTCAALAEAGVALQREPQGDTVLAQWVRGVADAAAASAPPVEAAPRAAVPPRRWDDAALADFAGLSSTIACECPRHVAEILMQLSHFEAYSAECEHRSPADADLHAHLREVTAGARARFEAALERVALHEGLILPP